MANDQPRHYLTGDLVLKESWSPEDHAIKIIPAANTEFAVELNHEDGDSVYSVRKTKVLSAGESADAYDYSECAMYGSGVVKVSPNSDGTGFVLLTDQPIEPKKFCAIKIKLESEDPSCRLVLKA